MSALQTSIGNRGVAGRHPVKRTVVLHPLPRALATVLYAAAQALEPVL